MEELTICDEVSEEKIFTPKTRRLCPKQKKFKRQVSSDSTNFKFNSIKDLHISLNEKSLNLDKISLDEINKDFIKWSVNLEEEECYDELSNILSSSTKNSSFESQDKKIKKVERPKNKKVDYFDEKIFFDLISESEIESQINKDIDF